jgi:hypothetical protein
MSEHSDIVMKELVQSAQTEAVKQAECDETAVQVIGVLSAQSSCDVHAIYAMDLHTITVLPLLTL